MNIANGRLSQRRFYQSHSSTAQHFLVGSMAKNCRSHTNSRSSGTHALQEHVPSQESTLTCWEFIQVLIFFSSKGHLKHMHLCYHEVLIFFLNWSLLYPFIYLFKRKGKDGKREVQLIIECAERCTNNALRSSEKWKSTVGLHVPHYCVLLSFLSFIRHSVQKKKFTWAQFTYGLWTDRTSRVPRPQETKQNSHITRISRCFMLCCGGVLLLQPVPSFSFHCLEIEQRNVAILPLKTRMHIY